METGTREKLSLVQWGVEGFGLQSGAYNLCQKNEFSSDLDVQSVSKSGICETSPWIKHPGAVFLLPLIFSSPLFFCNCDPGGLQLSSSWISRQ